MEGLGVEEEILTKLLETPLIGWIVTVSIIEVAHNFLGLMGLGKD
ncbi:hypothetical protein [Aquibacillus koreensis]|nr:hypothetical protein [Aquibacillus koreensis]